jgi:carbonyl reductase 1
VKKTLHSNYYGTLEATKTLLPQIKKGGRLVNVSSQMGNLSRFPSQLRSRLLAAKTVPEVTALMEEFTTAVANRTHEKQGWPSAAYVVSKAGCTTMTVAVAAEEEKNNNGVLVNACCPGWVNTDMTNGRGIKTPDQGAETPVLLALGDIKGQTGLFWANGRPTSR